MLGILEINEIPRKQFKSKHYITDFEIDNKQHILFHSSKIPFSFNFKSHTSKNKSTYLLFDWNDTINTHFNNYMIFKTLNNKELNILYSPFIISVFREITTNNLFESRKVIKEKLTKELPIWLNNNELFNNIYKNKLKSNFENLCLFFDIMGWNLISSTINNNFPSLIKEKGLTDIEIFNLIEQDLLNKFIKQVKSQSISVKI